MLLQNLAQVRVVHVGFVQGLLLTELMCLVPDVVEAFVDVALVGGISVPEENTVGDHTPFVVDVLNLSTEQ
jgi:hypothetical protein